MQTLTSPLAFLVTTRLDTDSGLSSHTIIPMFSNRAGSLASSSFTASGTFRNGNFTGDNRGSISKWTLPASCPRPVSNRSGNRRMTAPFVSELHFGCRAVSSHLFVRCSAVGLTQAPTLNLSLHPKEELPEQRQQPQVPLHSFRLFLDLLSQWWS